MKRILLILLVLPFLGFSQIGINTITPNTSSVLDVTATDKGVLLPQIDLQGLNDATTITNPAKSLLVWNTGATWGDSTYYYNSGTPASPQWSKMATSTVSETLTITSTGTNPTKATTPITDYITATDDGSGWVTIDFDYTHTDKTGASAGSGDYLYKLPAGYSFNTGIHPINTQSGNISGSVEVIKMINLNGLIEANNSRSFRNYVIPYDATHFRIITIDVNIWNFVRVGNFTINSIPTSYKGSFRFFK